MKCDVCMRPAGKVALYDSATKRIYRVCVAHRKQFERYVGFSPMGEESLYKDTESRKVFDG